MRTPAFSTAERCSWLLAALVLAAQWAPVEPFEYRRELLWSQPWRAVTGHFIHVNWIHALINVAALLLLARLFAADLSARRQFATLLAAAAVISLVLALVWPSIEWYRGLSGVLHALYFAGAATWLGSVRPRSVATLWLPVALLAGGWVKVVLEQPAGGATPYAEWLGMNVVPQAHLVGAVFGTLAGLVWLALKARRHNDRSEQQQLGGR